MGIRAGVYKEQDTNSPRLVLGMDAKMRKA